MTASRLDTVILASSSTTRQKILESAGITVETISPRVDEDEIRQALIAENTNPGDIAEVLAEQKARTVSRHYPKKLVIGADQILELDGRIINKPVDRDSAREGLKGLRGKDHRLFSCVCVLQGDQRLWHSLDGAWLTMRHFSDDFLEYYLDTVGDQAYSSPGSYRVEGLGAQLFSKVTGNHFTILGLPLFPLLDFLRIRGVLTT